jgi:hypothetical protein
MLVEGATFTMPRLAIVTSSSLTLQMFKSGGFCTVPPVTAQGKYSTAGFAIHDEISVRLIIWLARK